MNFPKICFLCVSRRINKKFEGKYITFMKHTIHSDLHYYNDNVYMIFIFRYLDSGTILINLEIFSVTKVISYCSDHWDPVV